MNRNPWLKHARMSSDDDFLQKAMDKFSHFGYAAFFILIELTHSDGRDGVLKIPASRLCLKLRSRRPQVQLYLDFSRTSGKLQYTWSEDEVEVQIKNYRKWQYNLKFKSAPNPPEIRLDVDVEVEEDKDVITDSHCEWYSKADGTCGQVRSERSKYCQHHKIKAAEHHQKPLAVPELRRMP